MSQLTVCQVLFLAAASLWGCQSSSSVSDRGQGEHSPLDGPRGELARLDGPPRDGPRPGDTAREAESDLGKPDTTGPISWGWDSNLTHRCLQSPGAPGTVNFYQEVVDCPVPGKRWTVAVQSEQSLGASCPGPTNQSLPINPAGGGILGLGWLPHVDELGRANWSVNLKTDLSAHAHPCGAGHFTWYVLMDHTGHGGGPFPRPDRTVVSATVNLNDFTPHGATRFIVGWQGYWNGKARSVELTVQGANWGDAHADPDIVNVINNATLQFVHMDGQGMSPQRVVPRNVETTLIIPWHQIVQDLVSRKILDAPSGGWTQTSTTAIFIGHETNNWQASESAIASLWVTNLRVESL